jgi:nucleotide-binding universal stress UspA family protein
MSRVFRRVLVGIDGSEPARDAVALALRLVDPADGELLLAHVVARGALRGHFRRRPGPDLLAQMAASVPPSQRCLRVVRAAGSAARGLCELAEEGDADLIVLGSHRGPRQQTTPGTIALRLLQGAPCALAIAPNGSREADRFRHIGVAYDASAEARDALALAYALAERDGAAVSVYHAFPRFGTTYAGMGAPEAEAIALRVRLDAQEQLDEAADAAPPGVNPQTVLVNDQPAFIADRCDGIVDLLIMGSRGYGPLHRVFAGSTSEAIMLRATQPIVVVPRCSGASAAEPQAAGTAATT